MAAAIASCGGRAPRYPFPDTALRWPGLAAPVNPQGPVLSPVNDWLPSWVSTENYSASGVVRLGRVLGDGRWAIADGAGEALRQTRAAVRERVAVLRRNAAARQSSEAIAATQAEWQRRRAENGTRLAELSRALLVTFPVHAPRAAALLDVAEHVITTFANDELHDLRGRLGAYDILGGIDVRARLRSLDVEPGERRLAELGPPQKTKKLNRHGRVLKITTALLVQGSCGIGKPFGEEERLADYLAKGDLTKLRRRLEADVKSLLALYEYGRLHGVVRLRWAFLDERIPAPWVHRDEPVLYHLEKAALALDVPLEVVVGSAPGWEEPWSRARYAHVESGENAWQFRLVDDAGSIIDELDVQRARLSATVFSCAPSRSCLAAAREIRVMAVALTPAGAGTA